MEGEEKSKNKGAGVVVGLIAVVVVVVLAIVLIGGRGSDTIKTTADFRDAITNKKAFNCTISSPDGEDILMQTSDGFGKIKVVITESADSDSKQHMLMLEGEGFYFWSNGLEEGDMAFKTSDTSTMDEFVREINTATEEDDEEDGGYSFKCEAASKADFKVPSDVDFMDFDNIFSGDDDEDWYNGN